MGTTATSPGDTAVIAQFLKLVGWRLLSLAFAGLFLLLVAAEVPADVYGHFTLVMTAVTVVGGGLLSLGNHALLRFGRDAFAVAGQLGHEVVLRLQHFALAYLAAGILLWLGLPLLRGFLGITAADVPWLLLGLLIVPLGEMGMFAAQATGRFTGFGIAPTVARATHLAVLLGLVTLDAVSWRTLFVGIVAGYGLAAAWTWASLPAGALARTGRDGPGFRRFVSFGWSIPLASLSVAVMGAVDLWFLRGFHAVADVGAYAWVYAIAMMGTALLAPLGALLANRYLDHVRCDEEASLRALIAQTRVAMLLAVGGCTAAAGVLRAVSSLLPLDLGLYAGAVAAGCVLVGGVGFQLGTNMWETMALGRDGRAPRASLVLAAMALTNIALDWLLVPAFSSLGAALATAAAYLVGALGLHALIAGDVGARGRSGSVVATGGAALAVLAGGSVLSPGAGAALMITSGLLLFALSWASAEPQVRSALIGQLAAGGNAQEGG